MARISSPRPRREPGLPRTAPWPPGRHRGSSRRPRSQGPSAACLAGASCLSRCSPGRPRSRHQGGPGQGRVDATAERRGSAIAVGVTPRLHADVERRAQAVRHCFTVPDSIAGGRFQGIAEGVPEVERHPDAIRVPLIGEDQASLRQGASLDDLQQLGRPRPELAGLGRTWLLRGGTGARSRR